MPDPQNRRLPRVSQFRHGELLVLFRRTETPQGLDEDFSLLERLTDELNDPDVGFYGAMLQAFADVAEVKLREETPFVDHEGNPRAFVALKRQGAAFGLGQVVLQDVWRDDLEEIHDAPVPDLSPITDADAAVPP